MVYSNWISFTTTTDVRSPELLRGEKVEKMKQFLEIVLQRSSSQQQLVVQLVLTQHTEKLHHETISPQN